MGFTFRKLYPGIAQPARSCCNLPYTCPCEDNENCTTIIVDSCACPGSGDDVVLYPCSGNPLTCTFQICPIGYSAGNLQLCVLYENEPCVCTSYTSVRCNCDWFEENENECCTRLPCLNSLYNGGGSFRTYFNECVLSGTVPHTYKLEAPNTEVAFSCEIGTSIANPQKYEVWRISETPDITGYMGDPAFTRIRSRQRYYKEPNNALGSDIGMTTEFSWYCLRLHETESQKVGIENRLMFVSGTNVYNYTSPLSGDPAVPNMDPFWSDSGGSGIKEIEESLGRTFPLPDSVMGLPLWGQEFASNAGIGLEDDCVSPYEQCNDGEDPVCRGCRCIQSNPSFPAQGHYLSNNQGYTAGYFSFSCFNPHCYLDHTYLDEFNQKRIEPAGWDNQLGFGAMDHIYGGGAAKFVCDLDGGGGPVNCTGFAGATSHGPRLGVPTCSVWALVKALYARVLKAFVESGFSLQSNLGTKPTEANFRQNGYSFATTGEIDFYEFATAVDNLLAADPSGTTNNTSNVQYHLAKVREALEINSNRFLDVVAGQVTAKFEFTFPNVFLWDRDAYVSASATDKWKHLYVIGNGNIIYDSGSVGISGPYAPYDDLHEDVRAQTYRSSVILVNRIHQPDLFVTESSRQARMFVFNGSGGPVTTFSPDINRRQATSMISFTHMPMCSGMTHPNYSTVTISPCTVCNGLPQNPVCLKDPSSPTSGPGRDGCGPVRDIDFSLTAAFFCGYQGGRFYDPNCLTASYSV